MKTLHKQEMTMRMTGARVFRMGIFGALLLQAGCAGTPIQDGNRMLVEVSQVLTREQIRTGEINDTYDGFGREPIRWPWLHEELLKRSSDEALGDGSVVVYRTFFYRHNAASGMVRQFVRPARVAEDTEVQAGQVAEVEFVGGVPTLVRIRHQKLEDGQCEYRRGERNGVLAVVDAINPIGGPAAASLYCPTVEAEGWTPVRNGPGTQWFKQPLGAQGDTNAARN